MRRTHDLSFPHPLQTIGWLGEQFTDFLAEVGAPVVAPFAHRALANAVGQVHAKLVPVAGAALEAAVRHPAGDALVAFDAAGSDLPRDSLETLSGSPCDAFQ